MWVNLWAGNKYKGLGASWEHEYNGSGGEYPRGQHTRGIVYWSLKVADTVFAVCLHPPRDASVSPGVQRSEADP